MDLKITPKVKVVAFDFFDTLVHRNIHPEAIIYEWARKVSVELNFLFDAKLIYDVRKASEKEIKKTVEEATYEELTTSIYQSLNRISAVGLSCQAFYKMSKDIELKAELKAIYVNQDILPLIRDLNTKKIKLIIISDFYFEKDLFLKVLREFDLENYFSQVYVSSEIGKRKSTGNLYKEVLNLQKVSPEEMLMIGDNLNSDYKIPKSMGIQTYRVPFEIKNRIYRKRQDVSNEIRKVCLFDRSKPFNGYSAELYIFVERLYKRLIINKVDTISFCSREGQFLKKIFDMYQESLLVPKRIKTHYFYISRKASLIAALKPLDKESFHSIFRQYNQLILKDFLKSIAFTNTEINIICQDTGLDFNSIIEPVNSKTDSFKILTTNAKFKEMYDRKRKVQSGLLKSYIESLVGENNQIFTIVDIGWKGSIQNNLVQLFENSEIKIQGYYFGLILPNEEVADNKVGIVFSNYPQKSKYFRVLKKNYMIYERIFVADHGSVEGYSFDKNNAVVPLLSKEKGELALFNYVKPFQKELTVAFQQILDIMQSSLLNNHTVMKILVKNALRQGCLNYPKMWAIEEKMREKTKENFGDISQNLVKSSKEVLKKKLDKRDFAFVDYSYKVFHKIFHSHSFDLFSNLYCYCVYCVNLLLIQI